MKALLLLLSLALGCSALQAASPAGRIVVDGEASALERYAAKELQRYLHQISGDRLEIGARWEPRQPCFVIGRAERLAAMKPPGAEQWVSVVPNDPGPQGYVLKKLALPGQEVIVIGGSDAVGCLYGVYGLLEDHYGIGFYLGGDVLPDKKTPLTLPAVDERKAPMVGIRGFLPWTNFPQSATVYSWDDWRFIIDQAAKMRFNFIHIHNYNGETGHNEPFHNFAVGGKLSRVWMPTARTGHGWSCPGWDIAEYRFGAADLFDDYDFGSDCALHHETLSNMEVFRKGVSLFQRVIAYAHARGVRVGLGLDINLVHDDYMKVGLKADDPRVISARVEQIATDYPDLDYLLCFQSENVGHNAEFFAVWRKIFMGFYDGLKQRSPKTRLAVSGWGLNPEAISGLPADVIASPIARYSDRCTSGAEFGDREYWGCPWLERDWGSSQYYYPYELHLDNTITAWNERAPNLKGFYCLTWRLTDAVEPRMSFISKAPWDHGKRLASAKAVYRQYAALNYGSAATDDITAILDNNEPFVCNFGECQDTPAFAVTPSGDSRVNMAKADGQLAVIDKWIAASDSPAHRARLGHLRCRIAATRDHNELIETFNFLGWEQLPGATPSWVRNFTHRVTDISSLGNVTSMQNRFIQRRYLSRENELRAKQPVKAPSNVTARGTRQGAVIQWNNEEPGAVGFNVYRDRRKLNAQPLSASTASLTDAVSGDVRYTVTAVTAAGQESPPSVPAVCAAGSADRTAPEIVVVSPPASALAGQPVPVKARLLDGRCHDCTGAALHFRQPGAKDWKRLAMTRRVRSVFAADIPGSEVTIAGLEYYITATDGDNPAVFPPSAPALPLSLVVTGSSGGTPPGQPGGLVVKDQTLRWNPGGGEVFLYRIYRGRQPDFAPGGATLLTYVDKSTTRFKLAWSVAAALPERLAYVDRNITRFKDSAPGFDGRPLQGTWYYRVTALNFVGDESPATPAVAVEFP